MILHLLSLMRWEWFKLRRRWFPWILLVIFILFTQMFVWIGFLVYSAGNEDGSEELFLLPGSVTSGIGLMFGLAIVLMITLSSSVLGTEYGWGTLRTVMARGPGRWPFLVAKFGVVALAGLAALVVAAVSIGISSIVTSGLVENGSELTSSGEWSEAVLTILKAAYVLIPYALLAAALTVLTSSATVGLAITVGYHIAEQIVVPILIVFVDGFDTIAGFTLGISANTLVSQGGAQDFIFLVTTIAGGELPGTTQAFLVLLGYSALFGAAALWLFQKRDITGAKGT